MQFTNAIAVLAAAATAHAWANDTIVWTTLVVDSYVTVCPASSTITYQGVTYTNTLTTSSTITVTNCPCTVSAPVSIATSVAVPTVPTTVVPTIPTTAPAAPVYPNGTIPGTTSAPAVVPTTTAAASSTPSSVVGSGANKAFAMSGASLAGLLGLAAYLL